MVLDKLTQRAKRVVSESWRAAPGGEAVLPGVFLGFLSEEKSGIAAEIVAAGVGSWEWEEGTVPLAELVEAAYVEAQRLEHSYVGTEHLLLALVSLKSPQRLDEVREKVSSAASFPTGYLLGKSQSKTPLLDSFGVDLTQLAKEGELDPVVGRGDLLEKIIQTILRKEKNNPILIGEVGVGKTALVRGLAHRIASSQVPLSLLGKKVVHFDFPSFLASFSPRGDLEAGFSSFLDEVRGNEDVLLFIDDLHSLMGGGSVVGVPSGVVNILKEVLTSGELHLLGATNSEAYRRHLEFDRALVRWFQPIVVPEPSVSETEDILRVLAPKFEAFHQVKYPSEAISQAVALSKRYVSGRFLPDKAVDVLDEAGAWVRAGNEEAPSEFRRVFRDEQATSEELGRALESQDLDRAVSLRSKRRDLRNKIEYFSSPKGGGTPVSKEVIAQVVSRKTGVPLTKLARGEREKFREMELVLGKRVVGQDYAVCALSRALRRQRVGLSDPRRPIGSFLFLGPTGVGKTELARELAGFLFGNAERLIRFDMSEFRERHTASRLVGAPPGYVGYGRGGELTERVRENPYSVVVFDEMEKAHPEVLNLLLQIMEEGELRDGQGRVTDFRSTVIIMTSNVGANLVKRGDLGFQTAGDRAGAYERMREKLMDNLEKTVSPEFLNRLSDVLVFRSLTEADILEIVDLRLADLSEKLSPRGLSLKVTSGARKVLAREGYSEEYGARFLNRAIESIVEVPLSEGIVRGDFSEGTAIDVRSRNGTIEVIKQ